MEVFRIASDQYTGKLTASGKSNRWNKDNQFVLYTGQSRSLSTLELVVHGNIAPTLNYEVMVISIPDNNDLLTQLEVNDLPANWRNSAAYPKLQNIGSDWYRNNKSLILRVPSAIIPQEYNYLINLYHPDFNQISHSRNEPYFWDNRLV